MPDTFFKILGGTDPVTQSLGNMTQGIGYPLRAVEPSVTGGPVNIQIVRGLRSYSYIEQEPLALGVAEQITFGPPETTTYFDIDALGNITCLVSGDYALRAKFVGGRRGQPNDVSQIYVRALVDGVPRGNSSHIIVDAADAEIPFDFEGTGPLVVGEILTFQIVLDIDGDATGGLQPGLPDVVGWADSPSASVAIDLFLAVES